MPRESSSSVKIFSPRYSRQELIERPQERLRLLAGRLPLRRAVLFGSWSQGRATAFSDIDLLLIYDGPPDPQAYSESWRVLDTRGLELHLYSQSEYEAAEPTIEKMSRAGVRLYPR
ncbi:MAG: nucleotidyltransferase family protein [Acidobacteriota bacterium]